MEGSGMQTFIVVLLFIGGSLAAGTPKNIREEFIARCNKFQASNVVSDAYGKGWKKRDCTKVADDIINGFKNKDGCGVPDNAFEKAIQSAMQPMAPNKMTLWSGLYQYSKDLAGVMGLYTLETGTLTGYLADGLTFCGKKTPPGIDFSSCPAWGSCKQGKDAVGVYWTSVSRALAKMAKGVVKSLLSGSGSKKPFRKDSVCGSIEIPNLNPKQVTKVEVLLVHIPGEKVVETCATGASIKEMKAIVEKNGIAFSCIDDPKPIRDFLCKKTKKC